MLEVLRQVLDRLVASGQGLTFSTPPRVAFRYEHEDCPCCEAELYVQKSKVRQVVTLHVGAFDAHETVMFCKQCDGSSLHSEELKQLVPAGCNFGYDVMILVGFSLLLNHRTVDETMTLLGERNVRMSPSEVRELAARFVAYLGMAHLQAAPAMSKSFALNGGYILHLDSTSRKYSRKMLTGIDELTGLVLLNVKLSTETADDIATFLREIVKRYGPPLAVGCDMAASIRAALLIVLPNTPVYICHFHFLRDAGTDLMKSDYQLLSRALDTQKITKKLRALQVVFKPHLITNAKAIEQFLADTDNIDDLTGHSSNIPHEGLLAGLLYSALEAERQGDGFGFPFDRPKLHFYNHLLEVSNAVSALRENMTGPQRKLADRLFNPLAAIKADKKLARFAKSIHRDACIFDRMRTIMRVAEPGATGGLNNPDMPVDLPTVKDALELFKKELEAGNRIAPRQRITKLIEQIDRHWDGLFRPMLRVTASDGNVYEIQPQRTNNIMEHFFRDHGRYEHRRTGLDLSARRLDAMLPDTPIACNLRNVNYMKLLLDGATSLEQRFSRIDAAEVRASLEAARSSGKVFSRPRKAHQILRRITTPIHFAIDALKQAVLRLKGNVE